MTLLISSAKFNYEIADVRSDRMIVSFKRIMENSGETSRGFLLMYPSRKKKSAHFSSYYFRSGSLVDIICMRARRK